MQWAIAAYGPAALGGYVTWARWRLRRTPGAFTCRLRQVGAGERWRWRRRTQRGRWVHDVLLVHQGLGIVAWDALPVVTVADPVPAPPTRRFGDRPVRLRLKLDDERQFDLVVGDADVQMAFGPFVVAQLTWGHRSGTA